MGEVNQKTACTYKAMDAVEREVQQACDDLVIPCAGLFACNGDGSFYYGKTFGNRSVEPSIDSDSVYSIASCTKLMTGVSVLQCVERGQIGLDDDVTPYVHEIASLEVVEGFDESGQPVIQKRQGPISARQLLSHSSGLTYAPFDAKLMKYQAARGETPGELKGTTLAERYLLAMVFQPGAGFQYGSGADCAGRLVERLNNTTLEDYMRENIWEPLGIKSMTFWPSSHPEISKRELQITARPPDGGKVVPNERGYINDGLTECLGGQGVYATLPDYMKVLRSLLKDDGVLLKSETAVELFKPQLSLEAREMLDKTRADPHSYWPMVVGEFPSEVPMDYGLGGIITLEDISGWRGKGTLHWSGYPNLLWSIDRKNDLCTLFGTQVLPPGDKQVEKLMTMFEKAMHQSRVSS